MWLEREDLKKTGLFLLVLVLWLALSAGLTGCATAAEHIRIAYLPINVDLPLFVAAENGYFKSRGLDVELTRFESSTPMGTALVNGDVDAVASIAFATVLSIESRDPGRFTIFIVDAETPKGHHSSMVAMPASGITKVEDLKGKKLGIFPGPSAGTFFRLVLRKHGIDPNSDVSIVELDSTLQVQALVAGQVDALLTYEPMSTEAVVDHGAVMFFPGAVETDIMSPWPSGVWVVSNHFLTTRPAVAQKLIDSCYEAIDYIRAHPQEAKGVLNKYTGISSKVALQTPDIPFTKIGEVNLETLQKYADVMYEAQVISHKIEASKLLFNPKVIQ